jgi:predicted O-methyltransferase YrrM
MNEYEYKLNNFLYPLISKINKINILEFGVQKGRSTLKFLEICNNNDGHLFSADIDDCSDVSRDPRWTFIKSRDDNFDLIKSKIPKKVDVIFIDSIHESAHVEKIFYNYYDHLKIGGYIFVDDISHLPYLNNKKSSFYCEINNRETFNELLKIYYFNQNRFDLNFSFKSSGLAIIHKTSTEPLQITRKVISREFSPKNFLRKLWKNLKKN